MTTYFAAPDGHGDDTLWVRYDEPADLPANPLPVIRRSDLGPMADHWDEIVARVTAGNLSAQQAWALDRAGRMEVLRDAMVYGDSALVVNPPSTPALDKAARHSEHKWTIILGDPTARCKCGATMNVPVVDAEPPPAETFNAITDWREPVPGWETLTHKTLGSAVVTREYTVPKGQ